LAATSRITDVTAFNRISVAAACLFALVGPAAAATAGFSLTVNTGTSADAPLFTLVNLSDSGLTLNAFAFTIGDTAYNFDAVTAMTAPAGGAITLTAGDTVNGGARSDAIAFGFTGFDSGEIVGWKAEIDLDTGNSVADHRAVFFNNGAVVPNSIGTALFSDGRSLAVSLAGDPGQTRYIFSALADDALSTVPVPAAMPLLAGALGLLGVLHLRKNRLNPA
jgi:hypothetical protein